MTVFGLTECGGDTGVLSRHRGRGSTTIHRGLGNRVALDLCVLASRGVLALTRSVDAAGANSLSFAHGHASVAFTLRLWLRNLGGFRLWSVFGHSNPALQKGYEVSFSSSSLTAFFRGCLAAFFAVSAVLISAWACWRMRSGSTGMAGSAVSGWSSSGQKESSPFLRCAVYYSAIFFARSRRWSRFVFVSAFSSSSANATLSLRMRRNSSTRSPMRMTSRLAMSFSSPSSVIVSRNWLNHTRAARAFSCERTLNAIWL